MAGFYRSSRIIFVLTSIIGIIFLGALYIIFWGPIYIFIRHLDGRRFKNKFNYWNNAEIEIFIKEVEKLLKYHQPAKNKLYLELLLAQCYNQTNKLEKTKSIIDRQEELVNNSLIPEQIKASIFLVICEYYILMKNYQEALKVLYDVYDIYNNSSLEEKKKFSQNFYYTYKFFDYVIMCNIRDEKDILEEAEEFLVIRMENNTLMTKLRHSDQLLTIYEKLGNKEKAKEYAKFLIENHKDYYVDPKRITKYSK